MCDYSLQQVATRKAEVGDKLITTNFGTGTRGFALAGQDNNVATCVLPGTELAFEEPIRAFFRDDPSLNATTAIFRQINRDNPHMHHDVLELADGSQVMLTHLLEGQFATVLQLPAVPKTEAEREEQRRAEFVG